MLVDNYQLISDYGKAAGDTTGAQGGLFESLESSVESSVIEFPKTPAATPQQKLQWEKETLGLYVSSHPLAGMRKYIARKASLIGELTAKEVNKKITIAGIAEGVKKIRTKKGDTMAIVMIEDPSGKMEVTMFPRLYAEAAPVLEQPDTVLKIEGVVDFRMGQLQMRADKMSRSSLSAMIKNAKEGGFFDEEEAKRGISVSRKMLEEEAVEALDEEGNVIAGETVKLADEATVESDEFLGALGKWILAGMSPDGLMEKLSTSTAVRDPLPETDSGKLITENATQNEPSSTAYVLSLPARAPKQLLLDLKEVLVASPGTTPVSLLIGSQTIKLPITAAVTPELEAKLEAVIKKHSTSA